MFDEMRQQAEPSLSAAGTTCPSAFPTIKPLNAIPTQTSHYMNMNNMKYESAKLPGRIDSVTADDWMLHQMTKLEGPQMRPIVGSGSGSGSGYAAQSQPQLDHSYGAQDSPVDRPNRHRRTESEASIASAASIADINIDETRTDTGVTVEEIAQFIQGPETTDGKWTCLFEDCGKQFGRKENIKSHVQTHLNDRQYQCPACMKCFVRQHDLKRHAKIHTGIKPYPCDCGNRFARHDALTRHRQRGMCVGAFDGIVRKNVKRGRPKKNRPEMDARLEKSAKARKKNMSISSISSFSGYSDISAINSPDYDLDVLSEVLDMGIDGEAESLRSLSSAPMPNLPNPTVSNIVASPSEASVHSYVSPGAIMERASHPSSPGKSTPSQYNTPPGLSQSSSSPPSTHFFELDPRTSTSAEDVVSYSAGGIMMNLASLGGTLPLSISEQEEDLLRQFTNDDSFIPLDRDQSLMMMPKFDEFNGVAVSMLNDNGYYF
ncbi:hypothetical protein V8C37DRAFT_384605 [Trichoderma ceciliae]